MTTAADLFAGLGGTSTGATLAGVDVAWAANHNPAAIEWHRANHPDTVHLCQDLAELDWSSVPQVEVLLASPACQGFSTAGQPARKGTGGSHKPDASTLQKKQQRDRNTAWAVLAAADTLRPRAITVENVVKFQHWVCFPAWCAVLEALGYAVRVHTLNARNFGGAQDRVRTVVTASQGAPIELPDSNGAPARTIADCLDPDDCADNRWRPIDSLPARMRPLIAKAKNQAGARCFWANVSQSRGRDLEDVFPTSTTGSGSQWNLIDGDRCRVINPRELARSMSFPETYALPTNRTLAGKLIGNAVDVNLARFMVEAVA